MLPSQPRTGRGGGFVAFARYATGAIFACLAIAVTALLASAFEGTYFLFALTAVSLIALGAGLRPALLALAICAAAFAWLLAPVHAHDVYRLVAFVLSSLVIAWVSSSARANYRRMVEARRVAIERAREEQALGDRLRAQLEFTRAITGALGEGVVAVDRNERLTFLNPTAERLLDWTSDAVGGRASEVIRFHRIGGEPLPDPECPLRRALGTGLPKHGDGVALARRDGSTFPVSFTSSPILRGDRVDGAVLAFQDFTEHLRAERDEKFLAEASRQLAESIDYEATLARVARLAVSHLADWCMVVVVGRDGSVKRVAVEDANPARAPMSREMLDRYPIDLQAEHGIGRVLRTGEPDVIPLITSTASEFVGQAGETVTTRLELLSQIGLRSFMGLPLRARGQILGVIDLGVIDSNRRYGQADLLVAEELARRCSLAIDNARLYQETQDAVRVREEILAIVSHDLKNPLGAIRMGAMLLDRTAPRTSGTDSVRRAADAISRSSERMGRLIHDLVDFASIEAGRLAIVRQPHDPAAIAREAVEAFRALAAEKGLRLDARIRGPLPVLECDRDRVLQVFSNLLGNAVSATPEGGVISIGAECRGSDVLFTVTDSGPGIPGEDLPHIFDRYWRGKSARYRGSGLGLAIAKGILDAHGGRIWAESQLGVGSTFAFTLPAIRRDGGHRVADAA